MNNNRPRPAPRQGSAATAPAGTDRPRSALIAATSATAGGPPAAVAVAFATSGKPGLAMMVGLLSLAAASVGALVAGPVAETLARGYVERRLLKAAAAEARRTDGARADVAVALIDAVHGGAVKASDPARGAGPVRPSLAASAEPSRPSSATATPGWSPPDQGHNDVRSR